MNRIALVPGDGIGPEVICEARNVLNTVAAATGKDVRMTEFDLGAERYLRECSLLLKPEHRVDVEEAL
jgi:isocitrate/isopropylmalate dehydrogenase